MAARTLKKTVKNVPVGTAMGRKIKTGSLSQKAKRRRPMPRYYEVKIRITKEEFARGEPYFEGQKYLPKFIYDAFKEKLTRAEANDKATRLRILAGNMDLLEPILREMHAQGKLNFLNKTEGDIGGDNNGKARET